MFVAVTRSRQLHRAVVVLFIYEKKKRKRIKEMNSLKHNMHDTPADYNF
jgi:hypothetical protein